MCESVPCSLCHRHECHARKHTLVSDGKLGDTQKLVLLGCVSHVHLTCLVPLLSVIAALETCAALRPGQTVLVTAAAGGTGQFAVQLAKRAGCYVIATAGGPSKAALCRDLGADRVVDYRSEKLKVRCKPCFLYCKPYELLT